MQLKRTNSKQYAFLPSGILIVEPNAELLAARAQLLLSAAYYVAASNEAIPSTGLTETDVRVAILSQSLGYSTVCKLAQEVRMYYPNAQILIFGLSSLGLDDQLYDEAIDSHCRPEQLLKALFRLSRDLPHQRVSRTRLGSQALSLSGLAWGTLRREPEESDPSKRPPSLIETAPTGQEVPSDETSPHLV
jgi:hypothetical protein